MRIALFGDIHANLEALNAVLEDSNAQGCTQWVCLGDIVGYNANPGECLELIRSKEYPVVKGNHDEDASGDNSLALALPAKGSPDKVSPDKEVVTARVPLDDASIVPSPASESPKYAATIRKGHAGTGTGCT